MFFDAGSSQFHLALPRLLPLQLRFATSVTIAVRIRTLSVHLLKLNLVC